jgi:hypothetical protein
MLFASLFLFDGWLGDGLKGVGLHLFPSKFKFFIELLAGAFAVYLIIIFALNKRITIRVTYLFFFFFFLIHVLMGVVFNTVPSGAIFGGIRRYFLFMPLFFLPMVYKFSDNEILTQLKVLLFFGLIQCPVTIYQRFFRYSHHVTGDYITGTLEISSILSLYQVSCIAVLTAFYIKKKIKLPIFLFFVILLFIPTTLNETKGTLVVFPIGLLFIILFGTGRIINIKKIALIVTSGFLIMFVFVPIYGYLYPQMNVVSFFQGKGMKNKSLQGYLFKGVEKHDVDVKDVGRLDILMFPFKILSKEPFKLILGLGIGNVNPSGITMFSGDYTEYDKYGGRSMAASSLIWELGLIGLFLYALFLFLIFKDAMSIKAIDSPLGNLALGWIGIVVILWLSFFYKNVIYAKVLVYLFWYISGLVVAGRVKYERTDSKSDIHSPQMTNSNSLDRSLYAEMGKYHQ